jgi:hypothetical protein
MDVLQIIQKYVMQQRLEQCFAALMESMFDKIMTQKVTLRWHMAELQKGMTGLGILIPLVIIPRKMKIASL